MNNVSVVSAAEPGAHTRTRQTTVPMKNSPWFSGQFVALANEGTSFGRRWSHWFVRWHKRTLINHLTAESTNQKHRLNKSHHKLAAHYLWSCHWTIVQVVIYVQQQHSVPLPFKPHRGIKLVDSGVVNGRVGQDSNVRLETRVCLRATVDICQLLCTFTLILRCFTHLSPYLGSVHFVKLFKLAHPDQLQNLRYSKYILLYISIGNSDLRCGSATLMLCTFCRIKEYQSWVWFESWGGWTVVDMTDNGQLFKLSTFILFDYLNTWIFSGLKMEAHTGDTDEDVQRVGGDTSWHRCGCGSLQHDEKVSCCLQGECFSSFILSLRLKRLYSFMNH